MLEDSQELGRQAWPWAREMLGLPFPLAACSPGPSPTPVLSGVAAAALKPQCSHCHPPSQKHTSHVNTHRAPSMGARQRPAGAEDIHTLLL